MADGRVVIDDSKLVHGGAGGLTALETGVHVALGSFSSVPFPLSELTEPLTAPGPRQHLAAELWYDPAESCPLFCDAGELAERGMRCWQTGMPTILFGCCHVTPARLFNELIDRHGSKAAPLAEGVIALIGQALRELPAGESVEIVVDKQGGRNAYAPMIQAAIPDGWVVVVREGAAESVYRIEGLGREVRLTFKPRAERDCLPVALASMLAKYLREAFMRQFNRYWLKHVPGVKPTAGYPGDAKRFYAEIRGAMAALGLREDDVWRKR